MTDFIYAVNAWGLPRGLYPKAAQKEPLGLLGQGPREYAWYYWMLDGIFVHLRYEVDGEICELDQMAYVAALPQYRGAIDPYVWYGEDLNADWHIEVVMDLSVAYWMPGQEQVFCRLGIMGEHATHCLAVDVPDTFRVLDRYLINNQPFRVPLFLSTYKEKSRGKIHSASVRPVFFPADYWDQFDKIAIDGPEQNAIFRARLPSYVQAVAPEVVVHGP